MGVWGGFSTNIDYAFFQTFKDVLIPVIAAIWKKLHNIDLDLDVD